MFLSFSRRAHPLAPSLLYSLGSRKSRFFSAIGLAAEYFGNCTPFASAFDLYFASQKSCRFVVESHSRSTAGMKYAAALEMLVINLSLAVLFSAAQADGVNWARCNDLLAFACQQSAECIVESSLCDAGILMMPILGCCAAAGLIGHELRRIIRAAAKGLLRSRSLRAESPTARSNRCCRRIPGTPRFSRISSQLSPPPERMRRCGGR